jgi:hypothetical protein
MYLTSLRVCPGFLALVDDLFLCVFSYVTSGIPQETVLGPTLFLVFINDIADNLHSTARVFADDCVIYRQIHTEKDHQLMQETKYF